MNTSYLFFWCIRERGHHKPVRSPPLPSLSLSLPQTRPFLPIRNSKGPGRETSTCCNPIGVEISSRRGPKGLPGPRFYGYVERRANLFETFASFRRVVNRRLVFCWSPILDPFQPRAASPRLAMQNLHSSRSLQQGVVPFSFSFFVAHRLKLTSNVAVGFAPRGRGHCIRSNFERVSSSLWIKLVLNGKWAGLIYQIWKILGGFIFIAGIGERDYHCIWGEIELLSLNIDLIRDYFFVFTEI